MKHKKLMWGGNVHEPVVYVKNLIGKVRDLTFGSTATRMKAAHHSSVSCLYLSGDFDLAKVSIMMNAVHKFMGNENTLGRIDRTLLGGTCTTIGTSTNLLVVSVAAEMGLKRMDMFDFMVPAV